MSQENHPKPYPEADSARSDQIGKVAETATAAYGTRMDTNWKPPTRMIAGLAADDEVWSFVRANDLLPHLETAIQLTRKIFPTLRELTLAYEPDPELPFFNAIIIYARATGTVEALFEQETSYIRSFIRDIPYEQSHRIVMLLSVA